MCDHAGNVNVDDDNKGPEKDDRMSNSEGLNAIEIVLALTLPQRKGRRLRSDAHY